MSNLEQLYQRVDAALSVINQCDPSAVNSVDDPAFDAALTELASTGIPTEQIVDRLVHAMRRVQWWHVRLRRLETLPEHLKRFADILTDEIRGQYTSGLISRETYVAAFDSAIRAVDAAENELHKKREMRR